MPVGFQYSIFKKSIHTISRLRPYEFVPYIVTRDVVTDSVEDMAKLDIPDENDQSSALKRRMFGVMKAWDKPTYFQIEPLPSDHKDVVAYIVVVQRKSDQAADLAGVDFGGWRVSVSRFFPDSVDARTIQQDPDVTAIYMRAAMYTLEGIMSRPTEFVAVKNGRSRMEVLRGMPMSYTVTISLAHPRRETVGSSHHGHSGIRMPRHHVREHERHYRSGKVVIVHEHERGDESIERRTVYRVVP